MLIKDFITLASTQLNDQRYNRAFTRWGRGLLLQYLNLGLNELSVYFPNDFTLLIPITLVPGRNQSVDYPAGISSLDSNEDGSPISEMDSNMASSFAAYSFCCPNIAFVNGSPQYRVISYAIKPENAKLFTVDPPVPAGMSPTVNAFISGQSPSYDVSNWNDEFAIATKYYPALIDWVLGSAKELNMESANARQESEQHFARFYQVCGIDYKQLSRFKSGYYEGKFGQGDMRVVRP